MIIFAKSTKKERGTFTKSTNKKNFALNVKSKEFLPNFIYFTFTFGQKFPFL